MGSLRLWEVVLAFVVSGASISAGVSEWPSQHDRRATGRLLVPEIFAGASVPRSGPALSAGTSWVGARMHPSTWRRLVRARVSASAHPPCVLPRLPRFASAPWPCAHLSGTGWPLRSGWCGSLPAPRAHPLRRGVSGHTFCLIPAPFVAGVICSSSGCAGRVVCTAQVCMPPVYQLPRSALCSPESAGVSSVPGPALCASRMRAAGWVCMPHHPRFREPISC